MLRSKVRVASLTAVVLFVLAAVYPSISLLRMDAQEPVRPQANDAKVKELQKERIETARELVKQQMARFKAGQADVQEVIDASRVLMDAELDACESNKERVAAFERLLASAKANEELATKFAIATAALNAKAERLRVEIALERAKAKKDGLQKRAANSVPEAKGKNGDREKAITLPATIHAYESVRLFARASGFLKKQSIDIGARVKRGDVLAVLDVPDLEAQVQHDRAAVERERSRVEQAKSRLRGAEIDLESAKLAVKQAEEAVDNAAAAARYRATHLVRMENLFKNKSVDEKIVDESKERYDAAVGAEQAAKTAVALAKSRAGAGMNKIEQAKAGLATAEANVKIAQATLEKSQVLLSFATITAPFDGVVTQRGYFPGDFIQSAENAKEPEPLMTIQRTDLLRVIAAFPERDVPFVDRGDAAEVEIDVLPGKKWSVKIARIAWALDPATREMSVEMDLPNPTGRIRSGMYGRVTIVLDGKKK